MYVFNFDINGAEELNRIDCDKKMSKFFFNEEKRKSRLSIDDFNLVPQCHKLACALMVMCGERPISVQALYGSKFNLQMIKKMYNVDLYNKIIKSCNQKQPIIQFEKSGTVTKRCRRVERVLGPSLKSSPVFPEKIVNEYNKLNVKMDIVSGIQYMCKVINDDEWIKNAGKTKSENKKIGVTTTEVPKDARYQYLLENNDNSDLFKYMHFFKEVCGITLGICVPNTIIRDMCKKLKLIELRPDGVDANWAWQTPEPAIIKFGYVNVFIDEDFAKEFYDLIRRGSMVAGYENSGVIEAKLPQFFSDMRQV